MVTNLGRAYWGHLGNGVTLKGPMVDLFWERRHLWEWRDPNRKPPLIPDRPHIGTGDMYMGLHHHPPGTFCLFSVLWYTSRGSKKVFAMV